MCNWPCALAGRPAAAQQSAFVVSPACPSVAEPQYPSVGHPHLDSPPRRRETNLCYPVGQRTAVNYRISLCESMTMLCDWCQQYWYGCSRFVLHSGQRQSHVCVRSRREPLEAVELVGTICLWNSHRLSAAGWGQWKQLMKHFNSYSCSAWQSEKKKSM